MQGYDRVGKGGHMFSLEVYSFNSLRYLTSSTVFTCKNIFYHHKHNSTKSGIVILSFIFEPTV